MGITAKDKILQRLSESAYPIALHEFGLIGVSECSISARLRELKKAGRVESVSVPGKKYTSWQLTTKELVLQL